MIIFKITRGELEVRRICDMDTTNTPKDQHDLKPARRWERRQFLATVATRIVAIILEPLLDRWYGGTGNGRLL